MKKKSILAVALTLPIIFSACSDKTVEKDPFMVYGYEGGEDKILLENDVLEMHFDPLTSSFDIVEKKTGAIWYSTPDPSYLEADSGTTPINKRAMLSPITLTYTNTAGTTNFLDCNSFSIGKGLYDIEVLSKTSIKVNYTIGNIERVYYMPNSIPESRMNVYFSQMTKDEQRQIETYYKKYDYNNLSRSDKGNLDQILIKYPDLEENIIYEYRNTNPPYLKGQMEILFEKYGYTIEDYEEDEARYSLSNELKNPVFNISVIYELEGNALKVTLPFDEMDYLEEYPIIELNVLPYFGAADLGDTGYMLVPDGSGGIINFNNGRIDQIEYNNNIYGWDEGLYREAIVSDNKAPYPVFGLQRNDNTILCIIEEGASYATIKADISGRGSNYNNVFARYSMIHSEKADIAGKSDKTILVFEDALPAGEQIVQKYIFCDKSGYVGMAKEYREYLMAKHPELQKMTESNVPVAVEIVGAVNKTQHVAGIPFDLPLKLTSLKEAEEMAKKIDELGIKNVNYSLTGWFNGSIQHSVPSSVDLISRIGSAKDLKNLNSTIETLGSKMFLEANFLYMTDTNAFDGFSLNTDAARLVSRERIENYPYSFIWYGERDRWGKLSYLAKPNYMMELIDNFVSTIDKKYNAKNIAFRTIGNNLAADYDEKRLTSRESVMNLQVDKLRELYDSGSNIIVNTGNSYTLPFVDFIIGMPLAYQGFGIVDYEVPFYQIALHGLVPYSGRAINLAEDYQMNILNTLETGAGLFYNFMHEDAAVLQDTKYHIYYGSQYTNWLDDFSALHNEFSTMLSGTFNQFIVNHEFLADNVTVTEYENGTKVIVNKSSNDFNHNGKVVGARDYLIIKGGA